jgi:hypothetical protein
MEQAVLKYQPSPQTPQEDGLLQIWQWEWEGESNFAYISARALRYSKTLTPKEGDVIRLGAYRVRILNRDIHEGRTILCVRETWLGLPRLYSHKSARFLNDIWQRVLWTMVIWGLAEESPQILSWRDIKMVKWFDNQCAIWRETKLVKWFQKWSKR